ncbi:MAG: (2Fe-2S) ferredoxin domain-containing protein [Endomicrobiaceae bacterium]|jgi:(2Fe-2S) ferredoxin|nr:(2Fe-2S) ferredoxin domain-containing protein [Endomicrobiaceae bacterium]
MSKPLSVLEEKRKEAKSRLEKNGYFSDTKIYVGMATCEIAAGSVPVMEVFQNELKNEKNIYISQKGCAGRCNLEPTVEIYQKDKEPVKYIQVTPEKAREIIKKHIKSGKIITEWVGK